MKRTFHLDRRAPLPVGHAEADTIVATARALVGTPFHHQARLPGVGVDCVGVPILVARIMGYVAPDFDVTGYTRMPDGRLLQLMDTHLVRIEEAQMTAGDVITVAVDPHSANPDPQHVGILVPYRLGGLAIVHATSHHGRVVEQPLVFGPTLQFRAVHRFPAVAAWREQPVGGAA